jgi:hypothetical protein
MKILSFNSFNLILIIVIKIENNKKLKDLIITTDF